MSTYQFITARELYDITLSEDELSIDSLDLVEMEGWVRTNRDNGSVGFIHLNDGTYFKNVQLVYTKDLEEFETIKKCNTGYCINIVGKVKITNEGKQPFEIEIDKLTVLGECSEDYPLQKKRHGFEFLREIPYLRPRTNTFMAVFRIRSLLSMAIHEFFQNQGFVYVHTPIITGNDGEGAGEAFTVTTRSDDKYEKDFFNTKASLTVTGQLHVEPFAMTFRDVYTFGPTFRAEESNTTTHAAEFWMIEPEIAFADLEDDMDLIEDMIKYCINYVLENAPEEMNFLNEMIEKGLIDRLKGLVNSTFAKMTYTEAIDLIKKADVKFDKRVEWGDDLAREHERYLCEKIVNGPVFLTDYPKEIKAFYMLQNDDGKTVSAADLLVPGIGELVGGSAREYRYDKLKARIEELGMEVEPLQWYLDLRKYGDYKHAGFGIGFERFLMYITGMENIRDVTPYPRTPRNLKC